MALPINMEAYDFAASRRLAERSLALVLSGHSATDASVTRSLRSSVRLRNDSVVGDCAA